MLRKILSVLAITALGGVCSGELLLQDNFSELSGHSPSKAQITSGSLDYKFHVESGGKLRMKDYSEGGVKYDLSNIVDTSGNSTVYISYCLRSLNDANEGKFAGIMLYDDGREVFGFGNDFGSGDFKYWDEQQNNQVIGEFYTRIDSEVHMLVLKIEFNSRGKETIKIGLDPFCNRTEDRQPANIWSEAEMELNFDELRFRCGNDNCNWEFDELRVGTDWASVMPSDDGVGSDYEVYSANALADGDSEMIAGNTARFWPLGVGVDDVLPSMALESPKQSIGTVPGTWQLKPEFGTHDGKRYAYFNIPAEVDLYGTGEVTGNLLRNGSKIRLFNKDNGAYGEPDRLYQSHPWVLGVRPNGSSFGIIFDTTWIAELNLRSGILFTIPDYAPAFPVMVIEGVSPQDVEQQLAALVGKMQMPPRWSLGYQQCRFSYVPDSRAREVARTFRDKRIPCDVIWFDIDYMDGFRIFTFSENQYPDPKATNNYLHSLGMKGIWMIDPGVKKEDGYFVYDSGKAIDAWVKTADGEEFFGPVWPGDCVFPDFSNPEVCEWWGGLYKDFMAQDIDGVWNDMNEPTVFGLDHMTMPMDNVFRGGGGLVAGTHEQYHNAFGMMMVRASRDGIQAANPDKRPFVLTRSNYLGGHRYAATWTGDNASTWEHMKWSIPMSLNLSMSGQPFNGPDIGGFLGNATPELFGHWISVGAFYPFSRGHSCTGTIDHEPWAFGEEVEATAKTALERRYRLMPYLYSLFHESHVSGMPVMRPVFFADPSDVNLRQEEQAFMVGSDMIVVPRWAESIRVPKGIWKEIRIVGEDLSEDIYQCRMAQRGGSIITLGPIVQSTEEIKTIQDLTLSVLLDENGQASGGVYEDAGDGYEFQNGQYSKLTFSAVKSGNVVTVKCTSKAGSLTPAKRMVKIEVLDGGKKYRGYGDIFSSDGIKIKLTLGESWESKDIGSVMMMGTAAGDGSSMTISGGGADIEGSADEFHFAYKNLSGDCELLARIVGQVNTSGWAKAGVMIREDLTAGSKHAMAVITPENGVAFQRRLTTDAGATLHTGIGGVELPVWVKVKRVGDSITGYYSVDGESWVEIGSSEINMADVVYAGLAVTSHNINEISVVEFEDISLRMALGSVDRNSDMKINMADVSAVASDWYRSGSSDGDINGDGDVDVEDLDYLIGHWLEEK